MSTDHTANTKKQGASPAKSDVNSIGWYFVKEFYTTLNENPASMHNFYSETSSCIYGDEGESVTPAVGDKAIHELFMKHGFKDCKVRLSNVDSVELDKGTILVQAIGELANDGKEIKRFVQTFCLAQFQNVYYCKNDILRFLKDGYEESTATSVESWKEAESFTNNQKAEQKPATKIEPKAAPTPTPTTESTQKTSTAPATRAEQFKPQTEASAPVEPSPAATQPPAASKSKPSAATQAPSTAATQQKPTTPPQDTPKAQPAAESQAQPQNAPQQPTQPSAPKSWANLAAVNPDKWGNAVSKVEGTVAVAQPAPYSQSPSSNQSGGQRGANSSDKGKHYKKKENFPIYVKSIPPKTDVSVLKKAFSKFGQVLSVEPQNLGNVVIDFSAQDSQKSALSERTLVLNSGTPNAATLIIEERRNPVTRRDDFKGGRGSNAGRGNNDYERTGSGRGRTGGRPKPSASKQ